MKIAVILLYGLYSPERTDFKEYLDFIAKEIQDKNFEKVILCGGYTDPNKDLSEAASVKRYLNTVFEYDNYILEDKSISTNQNLEFASKYISEDDEIVVYGDLLRMAKICWISAHFLLKASQEEIYKEVGKYTSKQDLSMPFKMRNLTVRCFDFKDRPREEIMIHPFPTILAILDLYNKDFEKLHLEQTKKRFGL